MVKHFTGYHGTPHSNIASIRERGFRVKRYSFLTAELQEVPGDLGAGVYAYQDSISNAQRFAEKFGDNTAVLELDVTVDEDRYLDMDEEENSTLILDVYKGPVFKDLLSRYERTNKGSSKRKCLDGLVLEHIIHKNNIKVDLIKKKTYTMFKGLPPISHYTNGTELCIKNVKIIKNISEIGLN